MFLARCVHGWFVAWGEDRIAVLLEHADSRYFPTRAHAAEMAQRHGFIVTPGGRLVHFEGDV